MDNRGFGSEGQTGQDASAWVTEGLMLTECQFLPKAIALYFR